MTLIHHPLAHLRGEKVNATPINTSAKGVGNIFAVTGRGDKQQGTLGFFDHARRFFERARGRLGGLDILFEQAKRFLHLLRRHVFGEL